MAQLIFLRADGESYSNRLLRRWSRDPTLMRIESNNDYYVDIRFPGIAIVRGFYTAWTITQIEFAFGMSGSLELLKDANGNGIAYNQTSAAKVPVSIPLLSVIAVRRLKVKIKPSNNLHSPFFEVRGCLTSKDDEIIDEDEVVGTTLDGGKRISIIESNVTSYQEAIEVCRAKGGHLVTPDSNSTANGLRKVIEHHLVKSMPENPRYLIGLRKIDEIWRYSNNKTLGMYQLWDSQEPSFDKQCVVLKIRNWTKVDDDDMKWKVHTCNNFSPEVNVVCRI